MLSRLAFVIAFVAALRLVAGPALTGQAWTMEDPDPSALVACALAVAGWLAGRRRALLAALERAHDSAGRPSR